MKKEASTLQAKYTGHFPFKDKDKWFKWKVYRDEKTALEAKRVLERKFKDYQFRLKEENTVFS